MAIGTVKWFNPAKGFGIIEPEDWSKGAFMHISAVERVGLSTLAEGKKSPSNSSRDRMANHPPKICLSQNDYDSPQRRRNSAAENPW